MQQNLRLAAISGSAGLGRSEQRGPISLDPGALEERWFPPIRGTAFHDDYVEIDNYKFEMLQLRLRGGFREYFDQSMCSGRHIVDDKLSGGQAVGGCKQ